MKLHRDKGLEQINLFENVDVEFQGIAPNFSTNRNKNPVVGDTIIMTAEYDEQRLLENCYVTLEVLAEVCYVLEGLYQITREDIITFDRKLQKRLEETSVR